MATVDPAPLTQININDGQKKTVYTLLSNIRKPESVSVAKSDSLTSEDLVILRHNPATKGHSINRPAYLKLHRTLSPNRNSAIDKIKENFETNEKSTEPKVPKPVPRARRNRLTKSQLLIPAKHTTTKSVRYSLNIEKTKDVNSNNIDDNLSNDEDEYITIVRRSDSEESVVKIKEELSAFTLDVDMEKKNKGFRKIFSVFRNKDKKKKSDDNNKTQNKDNAGMYSDNYQNESNNFNRQSTFRHTTGGENYATKSPPHQSRPTVQRSDSDVKVPNPYLDEKIEREFAQQHIDKFNRFKQNFENGVSQTPDRYTPMDKPSKDSSSSAGTLESDRSNIYANDGQHSNENLKDPLSPVSNARVNDTKRDTPPRLLETKQDVRLVNPKALIPINSERALPNPYQNITIKSPVNLSPQNVINPMRSEQYQVMNLPLEMNAQRPNLSDTYGTVFDCLEDRPSYVTSSATRTSPREVDGRVPRSPSLEPSKLKLPPNREIVPLSPRVRSPIPSDNVSTEKIIATELLKTKKSPTPTKRNNRDYSPSHQRLEIDIDYPENVENLSKDSLLMSTDNLSAKPPLGTNKQSFRPIQENGRPNTDNYRQSQASPSSADTLSRRSQASPIGSTDKIITNAQVHINPSVNRTPTPNNSMQNLSLSPVKSSNGTSRPLTPSGLRMNDSPKTPQKEDMRKSVEAYYWKEVKKLKDRENYDLYMLQMQYGNPYFAYAEEPASVRRSRSLSPSASRNSRRSLSLPRDIKAQPQAPPAQEKRYYPNAIPENHAVNHQVHPKSIQQIQFQQQKYFNRTAPERRTFDGGSPRKLETTNSLYRPIFKRGSLNSPAQQTIDDSLKRKVSFSGASDQNVQWPTKNGFTKSPPQRRILDRNPSQFDDDVFTPNTPTTPNDSRFSQFKANPRIDPVNEEIYYNTKANLLRPNGEFYRSQSNINPQYMTQKQVVDSAYGQRVSQFDDVLYGQPRDSLLTQPPMPRLVRHGSIQIAEELYVPRSGIRRGSYQNNNLVRRPSATPTPNSNTDLQGMKKAPQPLQLRREIILNDEIFGQFGGYVPSQNMVRDTQTPSIYSSRQSIAEYPQIRPSQRQVSVNNKVCDFYGQIHDMDNSRVQQTGVIMGKLHRNPGSPMMVRNSYSQLPVREPFVRNSRLTASANDMYHRTQQNPNIQYPPEQLYGRIESQMNENEVFNNRPLPPVPQAMKMMNRNMVSDTDSVSDINDMHRLMNGNRGRGIYEEEWNSDGKSGRGNDGTRSDNEGGEVRGRNRGTRRDDPRRHTLGAGANDQYLASMAGQGGPLSRTMDLEGHHRGYPPPSNAMLFDDDPGIMSEVETSSTGFRRGGKQRSSLPVVRTPSKTLERPLVFLQYRNETKRALLPNEITSIDTVKALFVRSFPKQLTMEYLDSPNVKIYIHDSSKDMFYELEDLRSHLREIRDRSVLRLFESADVSGGLPMAGIGIAGGVGHFEDPSYFSEPEFDSEFQHQHIHKSKVSGKAAPYYMGSTSNLPRGTPFLRTYSPAVSSLPAERMKPIPTGAPPKPQRAYSNAGSRNSNEGPPRPPDRFAPFQRPANPLYVPDGYMSSPERGSRYEDPYYSQYGTRSGSITPVIDEEISDTELLDDSYSLYGVKVPPGTTPRTNRTGFPTPAAVPYDATRLRVENMERQLANLTGLVQKALTQPATLQVPTREGYRDKSVSFEKSVSFSDEPPDMNSPKQHSPQHAADTKPTKPAIKSSTLPRTSSQERDRLKPAPPPKPASLSPGQYDSRIYRDLQLTPEMYNQLRGLQKKAKDLRAEVRNLRRMSQAQAHSVKETIRDTFIKIRAMLLAGGEQVWQAGMDQERVRLTREEDLYKQEMLRLEKDLGDLESTVEELRGNVINRKTRVNMSDVENMALILSKSSKTVADLKLRFPGLQDSMKALLTTEMDKMMREEKFLKEEPERLESALRRCKKLTGTLVTLKRLASVQEQRLPCSNSNNDGRLSPNPVETPPVTPSSTHSKPPTAPRMGSLIIGGECSGTSSDSSQRPENALDALLDELQTFSKPHPGTRSSSESSEPPAIPAKGVAPNRAPQMADIGRKGSMDSASFLPSNNLTVSTATGSLRRLHSYPSGSDTDNSPPIQPLQTNKTASKPPIPERNTELLQHIASGKRIPPPPPPRTSSKSPLASPTSPSLPPRSVAAAGLQHIQNVQNMDKPMSQFEQATQNLGLQTLRRNVPNRSSIKDTNKSQTLPRNIGSNLQVPNNDSDVISASNSSSCESVNSQDGTKKTRKEELEQRHQELLKKQKALQEQYARLQQLQRGNNTLTVIPPAPDQLLKKTGSESNLLQKMGLQLATSQITGSLTNIPNTNASLANKITLTNTSNPNPAPDGNSETNQIENSDNKDVPNQEGQKKVYETDIL